MATSVSLVPGYEEVTIFGGSSNFRPGISIHEISKLGNTTLLIFGKDNINTLNALYRLLNWLSLGIYELQVEKWPLVDVNRHYVAL